MELMDSSESEGQFDSLETGTVYSLAKHSFSLSSPCHPFNSPGTVVPGFRKKKDLKLLCRLLCCRWSNCGK